MKTEEFAPLNLHRRSSTKYLNEGCCYCCYAACDHYSFTLIILRLEIKFFFFFKPEKGGMVSCNSTVFGSNEEERGRRRDSFSLSYIPTIDPTLYGL